MRCTLVMRIGDAGGQVLPYSGVSAGSVKGNFYCESSI